jgi:hypothetical protein
MDRDKMEKKYGVRYSVLVELEYIDLIIFTTIDPMHNLFLGTAKYVFKNIFVDKLKDLHTVQQIADSTITSNDIGRIPLKIEAGFSSFTAAQWKNFTLYYSLHCLYGRIDDQSYRVWKYFVEACHLLCRPVLSTQDVAQGHEKLMKFCTMFEQHFGLEKVTCNLHMHSHLVECILNYSSFHVFWLFAMERNNGILGKTPSNKKSCEIQFMRSFLRQQTVHSLPIPTTYSDTFKKWLPKSAKEPQMPSANNATIGTTESIRELLSLTRGSVEIGDKWYNLNSLKLIGKEHHGTLANEVFTQHLQQCITMILDQSSLDLTSVCGAFTKIYALEYLGEVFGSINSRLDTCSLVLASWCGVDGNIDTSGQCVRPGEVLYYIRLNVLQNDVYQPLVLARVSWFQEHIHKHCL